MKILRRAMVGAIAAVLAAGALTVVTRSAAEAHGALLTPGSRTYLCWRDGLSPQGNIVPQNPACTAAVNAGGANALYNWFGVLRSDGAGRMAGFIQDGQLCSGGNTTYLGFDIARADYPVTHLTAGNNIQIRYNNWARHPGTFSLYVTKDSWSPTRALAWNDLEATPFSQVTNPAETGGPGTADGYYFWNTQLPNKSGRHIVYSVWARSDSQETFYGCSDVVFDGGNGEVTGIGPGSTPTTPSTPGPAGVCTASYQAASTWSGGFQGTVTVTNSSTSTISGWTVTMNVGSATLNSVWNGVSTGTTGTVTVRNATYNGSLAPSGSTSFGFTANGSGTPTVSCSSP